MSPIYVPGKVVLAKQFTWNESVWNPSMLAPALWLDAADANTITLNSGNVSQWNDKSGNNRHLTQASAGSQPLYISSGLNGQNIVRFEAGDAISNGAVNLPIGSSARTMYVVYTPRTTTGVPNEIFSQGVTGSSGKWFRLQFRPSPPGDPYFAGFSTDLSDFASITLTTKIGGITFDSSTGTLYRNGTQIAQGALTLNTDGNQIGTAMIGDMAEAVFVSRSLATLDRQKLEGYLAHKWGLTANLPNDHPYKTVGPTP
jgi:hypothetical protein